MVLIIVIFTLTVNVRSTFLSGSYFTLSLLHLYFLARWESVCFNWLEHDGRKEMIALPVKGGGFFSTC